MTKVLVVWGLLLVGGEPKTGLIGLVDGCRRTCVYLLQRCRKPTLMGIVSGVSLELLPLLPSTTLGGKNHSRPHFPEGTNCDSNRLLDLLKLTQDKMVDVNQVRQQRLSLKLHSYPGNVVLSNFPFFSPFPFCTPKTPGQF
jgi:hypothetical protein